MEDAAAGSEASFRRSKRVRTNIFNITGDDSGDIYGRGNEPINQSPNHPDRGDSIDDFEEVRPKAKRSRATENVLNRSGNQTLIDVIKINRKAIPQAVKLWVEHYEKDPKSAIVDLLTMFFEACGAKYDVQGDMLEEANVDDVVLALVELAKNGEVEDYQSSKKKDFNTFKDNLVSFWDNLAVECQNGPLFDDVLLEKCTDYVIALSCTPPRVYRQVASLVGLQLVTSFITVAKMLSSQRETIQRQLNAEKKKRIEGPRVDSLDKRLSETHEKITKMESMMRKIFTGLFVHRYRDIDPNIRMSCIQSLGVWVLSYPSFFLQDTYLKYLGWTLNDKSAGVRKASVIALQTLYEVDDNVPSLGLFTERFSNRMIELADDVDVSVAVCAIGLVKQLLRHQLLVDDDLGPLYDLLIDEPPEIRRAIGELVYDHLIAQKFSSSQPGSKGNDNSSLVTLGRMLQILREFSSDPILSTYVIDDVWEYMKAMRDWKCIIATLLDENPSIELTENDATNMIRLLNASVKKATGERIVPATDNRKQYYTKAQKEAIENSRRDITVAMMKSYPQLLRKYMADKAKVSSLVEIILHMNLELYSVNRQEQQFKSVLQLIGEAFFKHGDKDSLRSCVKAMSLCCTESKGDLEDYSRNKFQELEEELTAKLKTAMNDIMDGDDEYPLLVNLKRLYELQLSRSVSVESLYDDLVSTLVRFRNLNDEVVIFLLLNMYLHIAWSLQTIVSSKSVSEATLSSLLSKRTVLFEQLEYFLPASPQIEGGAKLQNQLACRVCTILAELWCLFRDTNFSSTKLQRLGFCPDFSILQRFWSLCELQLNISSETEDEDLNGEYVEETNRDAVMIAAAKLIASDTVPKDYLAPEIVSHLMLHGSNIMEIVKHLIAVLRKKEDDVASIFFKALKRAYHRHVIERVNRNGDSLANKLFLDCKELAARLSALFIGASRNKHRADILRIVKDGVEYAFADLPCQLSFLEGAVLPFITKLPPSEIHDLLKDIQGRTTNMNTAEDPSGWRPYFAFVDTLQEKYVKNEGFAAIHQKEGISAKRPGCPRKQRTSLGRKLFNEQSSGEEDGISSSDHEAPDEQDEEEEEAPLIHTIRSSSKLRSLKVCRDENRDQTGVEGSGQGTDTVTASRTSGASS